MRNANCATLKKALKHGAICAQYAQTPSSS